MEYTVEGDVLVIRLPVSQAAIDNATLSASGKTKLVASGNEKVRVGNVDLRLSLNLMVKA